MDFVVVRYLHFLGILVLFATLVLEHTLLKPQMTGADVRRMAVVDMIFGISAGVVLLAGLSLWLQVGKPATFYTSNPVFHAKVTLFVLVALISIIPTVFFIKHRRSELTNILIPKRVIMAVRLELVLLLVIPLLAVFMAQGYGLR